MFEGKLPHPPLLRPAKAGDSGDELRPVSWTDLVARLGAARDFRATLALHDGEGDGSFDPDSAQRIAALGEGERDVNFDDLGNGKDDRRIQERNGNGAADDDPRE